MSLTDSHERDGWGWVGERGNREAETEMYTSDSPSDNVISYRFLHVHFVYPFRTITAININSVTAPCHISSYHHLSKVLVHKKKPFHSNINISKYKFMTLVALGVGIYLTV